MQKIENGKMTRNCGWKITIEIQKVINSDENIIYKMQKMED